MKKLFLIAGAVAAFLVGYGVVAAAYPSPAPYGRGEYHGYFSDSYDTNGTYVLDNIYSGNAFPSTVNSASSFTSFLIGKLGGNNQDRTGASFIIQTMIGSSRNRPPTSTEQSTFTNLVNQYSAAGRVNWSTTYCFNLNTYFQGDRGGGGTNDDAFFDDTGCDTSIVFTNANGSQYVIKRQCANPLGNPTPLSGISNWLMNGSTTVNNPNPLPGATIKFTHVLKNTGPTSTNGQHIWYQPLTWPVDSALLPGQDSGAYNAGESKTVNVYTVVVPGSATPGTQICERIFFDWRSSSGPGGGYGLPACATVRSDFSLNPNVTPIIKDSGGNTIPGNVAEPGNTITFTYTVNNTGLTVSTNVACTVVGVSKVGYYTVPTPNDSVSDAGFAQPATGCPRSFPRGNITLVTETVPAAQVTADKTICRALSVNPATTAGGTKSNEACILVASKPYTRIYGGDVSAGNAQSNACGTTNAAGIVAWNRESANGFGGAGAQFAALALDVIYDFASNLGNTGSAGAVATGLSFANTTSSGLSNFGGKFGAQPCMADYYGTPNGTALSGASVDLSPLNGPYIVTGQANITGGNIQPGQKVQLYVNGDVVISGPISYIGSWTVDRNPLLEIVAKGNIYIDSNVTSLDGVYIAQANGASGGVIYTCASGATPAVPSNPTYYSTCKNRLVVNGSFVAKQVQLLRTNGSVGASNASDSTSNANTAEVFNYSPAFWIPQPTTTLQQPNYDSITSLPPIL